MEMKCSQCKHDGKNLRINCMKDTFLKVTLELKKGVTNLRVPFNITCNNKVNSEVVRYIKGRPFVNSVELFWNSSDKNVNTYVLYYFDIAEYYFKIITTKEESYLLDNLKEKTWYRICLATINKNYASGRYTCTKVLTDFAETGPVVNVLTQHSNDSMTVSWAKPLYEEDNPQGYVIDYLDSNGSCFTIIVIMRNNNIKTKEKCSNMSYKNWNILRPLTIKKLRPDTQYTITIYPINGNRKYSKIIISEEGESGPVSNISLYEINGWLRIVFDKPIKENGKVNKYIVNVILQRLGICQITSKLIYRLSDMIKNYANIPINTMIKCAKYRIEVFPINGYKLNGGIGRMAYVTYEYKPNVTSFISNIDARFISSNVALISWKDPLRDYDCRDINYMVEVRSKSNKSDCAKMVISNETCSQFQNMLQKESNCVTKEVLSLYPMSTRKIYLGADYSSKKYQVSVWKISHSAFIQGKPFLRTREQIDCFTDCYSSVYRGIRSALGCVKWKDSSQSEHSKANNNFCIVFKSYIFCGTKSSRVKCNIPNCSNINRHSGCVGSISVSTTTTNSITRWTSPPEVSLLTGYLTLLYNDDNNCEQCHIQMNNDVHHKADLDQQIKDFYMHCKFIRSSKPIRNETTFDSLHQSKEYVVYIVPLLTKSLPGEVKKTSFKTLLAIPDVPKNIKLSSKTTTSLRFTWDKLTETVDKGRPDSYEARLINIIEDIQKSDKENVQYSDLSTCTRYCLDVYGVNIAGTSNSSASSCHYTLAPTLGDLKVSYVKSGTWSQRVISWRYLGNDNCDKYYKVEYRNKFMPGYKSNDTCTFEYIKNHCVIILLAQTNVTIRNLELNNIYELQVRSESKLEIEYNQQYGPYSKKLEFYTGEEEPSIYGYKVVIDRLRQRFNISWSFHTSYDGSIFQFIVVLKNSSEICLEAVNLVCKTCPNPYNINNLKDEDKSKRNSILNCINRNEREYYRANDSLNYIFMMQEPLLNFSVVIYAINLMGVHDVNSNKLFYEEKGKSNAAAISLCLLFLLGIIIIAIIVLYKIKKSENMIYNDMTNSLNLNMELKNQSTIPMETEYARLNQEKLNNCKNNSLSLETKNDDSNSNPIINIEKASCIEPKEKNGGVALKEFHKHYKKMSENNHQLIIQEYKKLGAESKNMEQSCGLTSNIGKKSTNANKNRFINILPFDQTRVKIEGRSANNDYINATYIPFINDKTKCEYIASQGPIEHSIADFWQMISTEKVNCIIMLTRTVEENKFKCLQYWPKKIGEERSFGNNSKITVILAKEIESESHIERLLIMKDSVTLDEREIVQLHMHTWFDHSAPDLEYFNKLLFRFQEVANNTASIPYLVHCSAGVGRTGTLISIDRIVKQLVNGCQQINIYDTVFTLRHYRYIMVQRQAQYVFIHDYIKYFLKKYMKMDDAEELIYFNEN